MATFNFNTNHLTNDLSKKSLSGGVITMISQGGSFILQMVSTFFLARLLTPDDFGLVAMVVGITGFAGLFKTMGLATATVQKAKINHDQVSTLFWINQVICILIAIIVASLGPFISWFFNNNILQTITFVLSITYLLHGLSIQHLAILQRQMRFTSIALITISSMLLSTMTGIYLAWSGMGYWSLIAIKIMEPIFIALGSWILCPWRPGKPVRGSGVRPMLRFGSHLVGFSAVNYFSRNLDNILIGRFAGEQALGLYSKAYQLMMLPIRQIRGPIATVALPAMSSLQNDNKYFQRYYLNIISIIAFLSMPFVVFLFICSDDIILILLGDQWLVSSHIFKILSVVAFIQPVFNTVGIVLVSLGQTKRQLKWGVANSVLTIIAFCIGINWGVLGVATAYVIETYIILLPSLFYVFKFTPISVLSFFNAISRPIIISLIMGTILFGFQSCIINQPSFLKVLLIGIIGIISYLSLWSATSSGRNILTNYFDNVKSLIP